MQQVIHLKSRVVYFHRNLNAGYSINKVTQTIISHFDNKEEYYVPYYRITLKSLLKNLYFIYKYRNKKGINHITGGIHYGILSLIGCKSVLTIHDTDLYDNTVLGLKKIFFYFFWYKLPLLFASKIVCISSETKRNVQRFTRRKDIYVIYNPVASMLKPQKSRDNDIKSNCRILLIGTNCNKNVCRTIEALGGLKCTVVIIGRLTHEQMKCLHVNGIKYENKYDLSDQAIFQEYCNCDIVSFCSIYEGFGMPIIEANSVGRAVICSNIEPLKEIASDAALFVNPYIVDDIRKGFIELIQNKELRLRLIENGKRNVKRFIEIEIAGEYKRVYDSIL